MMLIKIQLIMGITNITVTCPVNAYSQQGYTTNEKQKKKSSLHFIKSFCSTNKNFRKNELNPLMGFRFKRFDFIRCLHLRHGTCFLRLQ